MSNTVNNYTETDLGNISLNPRGEYDSSAAYEYLDTVSYQGGSYFCLAELETTITGIAPDSGHNSEHWQMIAAPGDMTPEYTAAYNDVIKKAVQVETSRAAVELAQQEIETSQADVQELHSDTVQAAREAENSKNSAANSAQSAEQSRKTVSESEQNINGQITGFDSRVSEAVEQSKEEINTTKQQAIDTITNQQNTSVNIVKTEGEKIITRVGNDAKTVASDRATVEEAVQTVLNNAQEVAQNTQIVASNTENAAASAESAKTSADNAAQSAKGVEDASKQIEQNKKDVASLKEDMTSKADKTSLAQTDRKLDALWKLNQGISYEFQTDTTNAYQKTVPSGAKAASIKSIGGKTIVWNQLIDNGNFNDLNGWTRYQADVTVNNNIADITPQIAGGGLNKSVDINKSNIYLYKVNLKCDVSCTNIGVIIERETARAMSSGSIDWEELAIIFTASDTGKRTLRHLCEKKESVGIPFHIKQSQLYNLTQMFGSGNEPSTPEEFEKMFPADYYPYNAGKLMSASANEVVEQGKNLLDPETFEQNGVVYSIPQAVKLDGYGDGIDDVCNYVDWENKKYHKRVGRYVVTGDEQFFSNPTYIGDNSSNAYMNMNIGQKQSVDAKLISNKLLYSKWCWSTDQTYDVMCLNGTQIHIRTLNSSLGITNEASAVETQNAVKKYCKNLYESGDPIIIYYELAEEEITDISEIIDDTFQEPLEVEAGGTLTFRNTNGDDYRIPVPSSEEYVISLAEVAK